ncbi:MAG: Crp/Fnr family transcriptional regulator [Chloroflexi bacterium]|nr:Crp/Fnr family transcriptional regulator [Chloroflexota bacterium]
MPAIPDPTFLRRVALFRDLELGDLAILNGLMRRQVFPSGVRIMATENPGDTAYIIRQGAVKVHVEQSDGTDVIVAILGPGEIVGEMSVVDKLGRSGSVITLEESTLFWIDREAFWNCLQTMPKLTLNLTEILSRRLRIANERIKALATLDVCGRVAHHLLVLAGEYGEEVDVGIRIPLRLTQADLASLVGASRVRVNQALVQLRQRKAISIDAKYYITVLDEGVLEGCS